MYHGVTLSSEPQEYRSGKAPIPFDYSKGFRYGSRVPPFGDTLIAVKVLKDIVLPYEITLDGRLGVHVENLHHQFITPASVLNEHTGSLLSIVTNESELRADS